MFIHDDNDGTTMGWMHTGLHVFSPGARCVFVNYCNIARANVLCICDNHAQLLLALYEGHAYRAMWWRRTCHHDNATRLAHEKSVLKRWLRREGEGLMVIDNDPAGLIRSLDLSVKHVPDCWLPEPLNTQQFMFLTIVNE